MQELINKTFTVIVPIGKFCPYKHPTVVPAESTTHSFCQFPNLLSSLCIYGIDMIKPWFDHINAIYTERREQVWKLAEAMGCTFSRDNSGMFVWAKLPYGDNDSERFIDQLLHEGADQ